MVLRKDLFIIIAHDKWIIAKELFASENDIVQNLSSMCNELIINLDEVEPGLRAAVKKFSSMMQVKNQKYGKIEAIGDYIKYVLSSGSLFERTRLIRNINTDLALHQRKIVRVDVLNTQ